MVLNLILAAQAIALALIVVLLASGKLKGPQGEPGEDGKDALPGNDAVTAAGRILVLEAEVERLRQREAALLEGLNQSGETHHEPAQMVQILKDGLPYHRAALGSKDYIEALQRRGGLSVAIHEGGA